MTKRYLVIADDLTGSNDTGVQMTKRGIKTEVNLFPTTEAMGTSIVLDTESRTISPEKAYEKVKLMTTDILSNNHFDLIYKKIDSTLRGNIVEEMRAVCDSYQPERIVFAPAFPKINRTTVNGIHLLNQIPLMETELAHDPLNPIWTDNINTLLKKGFTEKITHYPTDKITGDLALSDAFIHIFDIAEHHHLETLATVLLQSPIKTLYVGSAGLAEVLFSEMHPPLPTLSVVGSISQVSLAQMNYAEEKGIEIVKIEINDLLKDNTVQKYQQIVLDNLRLSKDVVLTVTRSKEDYEKTIKLFKKINQYDKKEISNLIKRMLAGVTKAVLKEEKISGMFLTGGDTAIEVIQQLEATGCLIEAELSTGIVKSRLSGGYYEGLTLVTKAGAFGNDADLYTSIQQIKK